MDPHFLMPRSAYVPYLDTCYISPCINHSHQNGGTVVPLPEKHIRYVCCYIFGKVGTVDSV